MQGKSFEANRFSPTPFVIHGWLFQRLSFFTFEPTTIIIVQAAPDFSCIVSVLPYVLWRAGLFASDSSKKSQIVALWQNAKLPSSRMGRETTKGSSCRGSMYLWPALRTLICGRHTTSVVGMVAWLWYQLRTVPGMSPQMMVLGDGRLSLGRNTQHDCSSSWWGANTPRSFINSMCRFKRWLGRSYKIYF